jgi:hypothetical protein
MSVRSAPPLSAKPKKSEATRRPPEMSAVSEMYYTSEARMPHLMSEIRGIGFRLPELGTRPHEEGPKTEN